MESLNHTFFKLVNHSYNRKYEIEIKNRQSKNKSKKNRKTVTEKKFVNFQEKLKEDLQSIKII